MTGIVVCLLALDGVATAERSIASARRFGLRTIACVAQEECGVAPADVEIHGIDWRDDFADARNQLAAGVDADWLLWLDADEELTAFDAAEIAALQAPVGAVWLRDRRGYTARPALRLQRQGTDACWTGAVLETLSAQGADAFAMLDGTRLDNFASENSQRAHRDRSRRRDVATRAAAAGDDSFGVALVKARSEEAREHGSVAIMAWVRAFKHAQARPAMPGAPDPRVEAAEWLCSYDYTTPALLLLDGNSAIANLRFQVLASILWSKDHFDESHFDALAKCLANGSFDRRYGAPA